MYLVSLGKAKRHICINEWQKDLIPVEKSLILKCHSVWIAGNGFQLEKVGPTFSSSSLLSYITSVKGLWVIHSMKIHLTLSLTKAKKQTNKQTNSSCMSKLPTSEIKTILTKNNKTSIGQRPSILTFGINLLVNTA